MKAAIPDRMKHLDIDSRGYAIPFGVLRDDDGLPHFAVNEEAERQRSIRDDLCGICGTRLLRGRWFVGGPKSAFDPRGCYIDMPMHDECAHYALQTCPYLALPRYMREIGTRKFANANVADTRLLIDPTMLPDRPALFVAVMAVGQRMTGGNGFQSYVAPKRPYRRVEFWRHGARLGDAEGWRLAAKECGYPVDTLVRLSVSRKAVLA